MGALFFIAKMRQLVTKTNAEVRKRKRMKVYENKGTNTENNNVFATQRTSGLDNYRGVGESSLQ